MKKFSLVLLTCFALASCATNNGAQSAGHNNIVSDAPLPPPYATGSSMNFSNVLGWKDGRTPITPEGFTVTKYADGFENPRWLYLTPRDVLVAESNTNHGFVEKVLAPLVGANKSNNLNSSANRITLLRDSKGTGLPDVRETFLNSGLNQPYGMLIIGNWFYVANTDSVLRFPYQPGQTTINGPGQKIATLQDGQFNRHWARNIITNADQSKLYVSVGSGSNVAENGLANEVMRANILEMNLDGSGVRVYAGGLRNPNGMDWAPGTRTLWTVVNERDELGDNLVPDYLTSVVDGGFYGWPYAYWGNHLDPRVKETTPEFVKNTIVPDVSLGNHHAPLGLVFYTKTQFPAKYRGGAFIAEHGSWNSAILEGYRVSFVPFANGKPTGPPEDFLTGFIVGANQKDVYGRPVDVLVLPDGSMLVTDDTTNTIWRIAAN